MAIDRVIRALKKDEKLLERLEKRMIRDFRAYRRNLTSVVQDTMANLVTDDKGRIHVGMQNEAVLDEMSRQVTSVLYDEAREAGEQAIKNVRSRLETLDRLAKDLGMEEAMMFDDPERIPAIIQKMEQVSARIANGADDVAVDVQREIIRTKNTLQSGGQINRSALAETISRKTGKAAHIGFTVANTELMAIDRSARIMQGEKAGINDYWYTGPGPDRIIRDFCYEHLDMIAPLGYWQNIENDTGPQPVTEYAGGYNCRHRLIFYKPEWGTP